MLFDASMKIVILDKSTFQRFHEHIDYSALEALGELVSYSETADCELAERTRGADVVITIKNRLSSEQLEQFSSVRLICKAGSGYDAIDIAAAKKRGMGVCNLPGYGTYMVAQWTWTLLMALTANLFAYNRDMRRSDDWVNLSFLHPIGELQGKTVGFIGNSVIAQQVATWARAFQMKVLFNSRFPEPGNPEYVDLSTLASQADFVSIHSRLDDQTRGLIGREFISKMRPSSYLINTGRAAIIEESALIDALQNKQIAGAALDVFWEEPLSLNHPLQHLENVILTPHMAWGSLETRQKMVGMLAEVITRYFQGDPLYLIEPK
jgi:glycerate dehydrogenase